MFNPYVIINPWKRIRELEAQLKRDIDDRVREGEKESPRVARYSETLEKLSARAQKLINRDENTLKLEPREN